MPTPAPTPEEERFRQCGDLYAGGFQCPEGTTAETKGTRCEQQKDGPDALPCEEKCCTPNPTFSQCGDLYAEGFECPATFTAQGQGVRCERDRDGSDAVPCEEVCCIAPPPYKQCGEVFSFEGLECASGLIPAGPGVRCETRSGTAGDPCNEVCCQEPSGTTCSDFLTNEFGGTCSDEAFYEPNAELAGSLVPQIYVDDLFWQHCCKPLGRTCEDIIGTCPSDPEKELYYTPAETFDNGDEVPREILLNTPEVVNFCCEPENAEDPFVWLCDGGAGRQRGFEINKDPSNILGSLQDCKDQCETDGCGLLEFNRDTGRCQTFMGWNVSPDKCGTASHLNVWYNPATALGDE